MSEIKVNCCLKCFIYLILILNCLISLLFLIYFMNLEEFSFIHKIIWLILFLYYFLKLIFIILVKLPKTIMLRIISFIFNIFGLASFFILQKEIRGNVSKELIRLHNI